MKRNHFLVIGCFLAGLVACQKTVIEAFEGFRQPTGFPQPAYRLADNPITRLVHMLSAPVRYIWRPGYQVVRSRKLGTRHG